MKQTKEEKQDVTESLGQGRILPLVFRLTIPAFAWRVFSFSGRVCSVFVFGICVHLPPECCISCRWG